MLLSLDCDTYFTTNYSNSQYDLILQYVIHSAGKPTLVVFRVSDHWRLGRPERWPRSIDDETAIIRNKIEQSYYDFDDESDELLDELDDIMAPSQNSSKSKRYGFAQ